MTVTALPLTPATDLSHDLAILPDVDAGSAHPDPALACLPATVDVAPTTAERCDHAEGGLPCVRRPHPEHPNAHVRVAGSRCKAPAARDVPRVVGMSIAS
jgi:hypothetical protein